MGKSILYIATSLDGFVAGKDDDISWLDPFNEVDYGFDEFFSTIGAAILGRKTYEIETGMGLGNVHPVQKFVLTHKMPGKKTWPADVVFTDESIETVLQKAKNSTTKNIWIEGGAQITQQFLEKGLLQEIVLAIVPVLLGEGIRLFENGKHRSDLTLIDLKKFDKGLIQMTYTVHSRGGAGRGSR